MYSTRYSPLCCLCCAARTSGPSATFCSPPIAASEPLRSGLRPWAHPPHPSGACLVAMLHLSTYSMITTIRRASKISETCAQPRYRKCQNPTAQYGAIAVKRAVSVSCVSCVMSQMGRPVECYADPRCGGATPCKIDNT